MDRFVRVDRIRKAGRAVVFVIAGAAESGRNTVGRLLAESLGWEFVDAENLRPPLNAEVRGCSTPRANADPTFVEDTLSTAAKSWIYEWRDVVLSCPVLTEGERKQLSRMSSLVKIVCLEEFHTIDRACVSDRSVGVAISRSSAASHASRDQGQDVFTLNLYRPAEEIIAELTTVLMT